MLDFRRRGDAGRIAAAALYARAVEKSRQPDLYATMGAPDTVEGRFELLTAHILLIIERLDRDGEGGRAVGQALFDHYLRNLDGALREMGVGDIAVAKRMKGLGRIVYGRAAAYAAAFASREPRELEALVARTILVERPDVNPRDLADHLRAARAHLAAAAFDDLIVERGE
jgi:cytochrome b pre-mRNA-processing protein 3